MSAQVLTAPSRLLLHTRSGGPVAGRDSAVGDGAVEAGDVSATDAGLATATLEVLGLPEVAFALVAVGLLASAVWAAQPHLWLSGVAAVPALGGGSAGLLIGPTSPGALLLLVLAIASLAMEVYSLPGLMLHAAGGATALAIAGLSLHGPSGGAHPGAAIPAALVVGLATWAAARCSWRAVRTDPLTSSTRLVGRDAVILDVTGDHTGVAVVAGHLWTVRDPDRPLRVGIVAEVAGRAGGALIVRRTRRSDQPRPEL